MTARPERIPHSVVYRIRKPYLHTSRVSVVNDYSAFRELSPTTLADCLTRDRIMDAAIRPIWGGVPRVAGPAFTVRCGVGDNLMLHAAIYRAPSGSIIVVRAADLDFALAGGNVCAVAQRNGIAAFVLDGAVRDVAEIRALGFPVFARAVIPFAGAKKFVSPLNETIACGGVNVAPLDVVIADEEGVVVVPHTVQHAVLRTATERAVAEAAQSLEVWELKHRKRVAELLGDPDVAS
jgi:4-hydroxy-4-methyl-2-oxoglutarate aldolase